MSETGKTQSSFPIVVVCAACFAAGFAANIVLNTATHVKSTSKANDHEDNRTMHVQQDRDREVTQLKEILSDLRFALNRSEEQIDAIKTEKMNTNATLMELKKQLSELRNQVPAQPPPVAVEPIPALPPLHGRAWGPEQATGEPDTPGAGDYQTAWASRTQDGQQEWLQLEYAEAVLIKKVLVVETLNPGALFKVGSFDEAGKETIVWEGKDPTPPDAAKGVSEVELHDGFKSNKIKIYLDSAAVRGWNEIDAVGIVDEHEKIHWAINATASSTFAEPEEPADDNLPLPPVEDF